MTKFSGWPGFATVRLRKHKSTIAIENRLTHRKVKEGIESLRRVLGPLLHYTGLH